VNALDESQMRVDSDDPATDEEMLTSAGMSSGADERMGPPSSRPGSRASSFWSRTSSPRPPSPDSPRSGLAALAASVSSQARALVRAGKEKLGDKRKRQAAAALTADDSDASDGSISTNAPPPKRPLGRGPDASTGPVETDVRDAQDAPVAAPTVSLALATSSPMATRPPPAASALAVVQGAPQAVAEADVPLSPNTGALMTPDLEHDVAGALPVSKTVGAMLTLRSTFVQAASHGPRALDVPSSSPDTLKTPNAAFALSSPSQPLRTLEQGALEAPRAVIAPFAQMSAHPTIQKERNTHERVVEHSNTDANDVDEANVSDTDSATTSRRAGPGTSKSTQRTRDLKERFRTGQLPYDDVRDPRWETAILEKDSDAQMDRDSKAARKLGTYRVVHSVCGQWVNMSGGPYDASSFREHVDLKCKGAPKGGKSRTLTSMFGKKSAAPPSPPPAPTPAPPPRPCSGVTAALDPRIPRYFRRSGASGGGSHHENFYLVRDYGGRAFQDLSADDQAAVHLLQHNDYTWRNDRTLEAVYAKSCLCICDGPTSACSECMALLKLKAFKNALNEKEKPAENLKFNNKVYKGEGSGSLMIRATPGLQDILNPVRSGRCER
jgi:hypothetical protein